MPLEKNSRIAEPLSPDSAAIHPLDAIRLLRSAGKTLFSQVGLHAQLAHVEWEEEKNRLLRMMLVLLLGFAATLCVMVFVGALVLAVSWETAYRIPASIALIAFYTLGVVIAWRRLQTLSALSGQAFAATREEIAMDIAMIRSKL
jgi:uncharacterized membrane protein YqjE